MFQSRMLRNVSSSLPTQVPTWKLCNHPRSSFSRDYLEEGLTLISRFPCFIRCEINPCSYVNAILHFPGASERIPIPLWKSLQQWHLWENLFQFEGNAKTARTNGIFHIFHLTFRCQYWDWALIPKDWVIYCTQGHRDFLWFTHPIAFFHSALSSARRIAVLTWIWINLHHITGVDGVETVSKLHFLCAHPSYSSDESELQIRVIYGRSRRKGNALVGSRASNHS